MSTPARSWNSVRAKPGQTAITRTPVSAKLNASPSLNIVTQALLAE